jgi:hypothetical protein
MQPMPITTKRGEKNGCSQTEAHTTRVFKNSILVEYLEFAIARRCPKLISAYILRRKEHNGTTDLSRALAL